MWKNTNARYGALPMTLHWVTVVVLTAVVLLMELRGNFPKGSVTREAMKEWHYILGLLIFALTAVRLVVRLSGPVPSIVPAPPAWQRVLASFVQWSMYLALLIMPLIGWGLLNADGHQLPVVGSMLPTLTGADEHLAETLEEIHELGADLVYVLLGLHVFAALAHHFLVRDNTLTRMLPRR